MQASSGVETMVREDVAALNRSDLDAVAQGTSRDCVTIGTDPKEYARTFEDNMALARESTPSATLPIEITIEELHAYEEGTVGWFDGLMTFISGDRRVQSRVTGVAHQEDGRWKSVQTHASIGVPVEHQYDEMFTTPTARRSTDPSRAG